MSRHAILSCSLRPDSASRRLAYAALEQLSADGHVAELIDLRDAGLPMFDDDLAFEHSAYPALHGAIAAADAVVIAAPVYNWGLGGGARTIIELTGATSDAGRGAAWFDKVVTFLCAGGLPHSYAAYTGTAAALMLDFKCVVNPYVTYATTRDWHGSGAMVSKLAERLRKTVTVHAELTSLLASRQYRSGWEI